MDWLLSATTLAANWLLGWTRGRPLAWLLHAANAAGWIVFYVAYGHHGLIVLSLATIGVDLASARAAWKKERQR